jgi:hypothetical protein
MGGGNLFMEKKGWKDVCGILWMSKIDETRIT